MLPAFSQEIPRVQEHLKSSALAWEKREGRPFMVHGLQITQYIEELWESRDMKKEAEKNKRVNIDELFSLLNRKVEKGKKYRNLAFFSKN